MGAAAFHPTVLTYWRRRLAASARPNRIFDAVREVVAATGALPGKTRRALDSTVLEDAVATQDTVTQLIAAIRRVAPRPCPAGRSWSPTHCTGHDYTGRASRPSPGTTRPPAPRWSTGWSATRTGARASAASGTAARGRPTRSGCWPWSPARTSNRPTAATAAAGGGGSPGGSPPTGSSPPSIPTPGMRTRPCTGRQDGFNAHVVVEPDTGLITGCRLTRPPGRPTATPPSGSSCWPRTTARPDRSQVLGDSAYGTGEALAALDRAGHTPVIKPWPLRPAVPGGFTVDDFTVDEAAGTATCPNGVTRPISRTRLGHLRRGLPRLPAAAALHHRRRRAHLHLHPHDALQRAHRARAADPDFQATYRRHRPMVERSLAWLTRGNRRVPYRGVAKNDAWLHLRVAAIDLRRLLTLGLTGPTPGRWPDQPHPPHHRAPGPSTDGPTPPTDRRTRPPPPSEHPTSTATSSGVS